MDKYKRDYLFGLAEEEKHFECLKCFDETIKRTKYNAIFDFEGERCLIELKSRNNRHNTYPTTMVGYNKILYAINNKAKEHYFVFNFTDGLYFYKFDENDLKTGKLEVKLGGRRDRGRDEIKDYCFISIDSLKKMESLTSKAG